MYCSLVEKKKKVKVYIKHCVLNSFMKINLEIFFSRAPFYLGIIYNSFDLVRFHVKYSTLLFEVDQLYFI